LAANRFGASGRQPGFGKWDDARLLLVQISALSQTVQISVSSAGPEGGRFQIDSD